MAAPPPNHHHGGLITRRSIFIGATASLICAPAIVRATSLMPVRGLILPVESPLAGFVQRLLFSALTSNLTTGRMNTWANGKIVSEADAQRIVAYARPQGWLPSKPAYR